MKLDGLSESVQVIGAHGSQQGWFECTGFDRITVATVQSGMVDHASA